MPRGKKKIRRIIRVTSGDEVVDWIFARICDEVLDYEEIQIVVQNFKKGNDKIARLVDGYCEEHKFYGCCIHVDKKLSKRGKWRMFFHELLHILCENTKEKDILEGERLLWSRMSEQQKLIIDYYFRKLRKKN